MAVNLRNSTHEAYIAGVRDLILERAELTDEQRERLAHVKLMYGAGQAGVRGVCFFDAWENGIGKVAVIEIGAMTQESWLQLAGTTLHELAHVLAGNKAGHSAEWKDAACTLGFVKRPEAAGQRYSLALFNGALREQIAQLAQQLADGSPAFRSTFAAMFTATVRPCSAGFGTRGGRSRGTGSGSRNLLWMCSHGQKIRAASTELDITCNVCGSKFELAA